ncbi:MAG: hypothetical protein WCD20_05155 [Rhodomicrobium sp.]
MLTRCINAAIAGTLATAIALTAVPAQIVFASGAQAKQDSQAMYGHKYRARANRAGHRWDSRAAKDCVWGYGLKCES